MKSLEEQIEDNRIQLELDGIYEKAARGDKEMIALAIEAIGNDDKSTEWLINLLNTARRDDTETNPFISKVRNDMRLTVIHELSEHIDQFIIRYIEDK